MLKISETYLCVSTFPSLHRFGEEDSNLSPEHCDGLTNQFSLGGNSDLWFGVALAGKFPLGKFSTRVRAFLGRFGNI